MDDFADRVRAELTGRLAPRRDGPSTRRCSAPATTISTPAARTSRALEGSGLAVPSWPREYGGLARRPEQVAIVRRELAEFDVPDLYPYLVGLELVGPTLLAHGTPRAVRALAADDRDRRGDLVPALLRTGRGLRPRGPVDARDARRRRMARARPEGVDEPRRVRAVRAAPRPPRRDRPEAPRHHRLRARPRTARASTSGRSAR